MHKIPIEENYDNQKHLIFNKSKIDIFLKDLNNELNILSNKNNIEDPYHNFMTISSSISGELPPSDRWALPHIYV
jgi:hypothetical protein